MTSMLVQHEIRANLNRIRDKRTVLKSSVAARDLNPDDKDTYLIAAHIAELLFQVEDFKVREATEQKVDYYTRETPCPVGKNQGYFGRPLKEIPEDFLRWCYAQPWLSSKYPQLFEYIQREIIGKEPQQDDLPIELA